MAYTQQGAHHPLTGTAHADVLRHRLPARPLRRRRVCWLDLSGCHLWRFVFFSKKDLFNSEIMLTFAAD